MTTDRPVTLVDFCLARARVVESNPRRAVSLAGKVAAFVALWGRMIDETGNRDPSVEEWGEWAGVSRPTAYRRQVEFRRLFGEWFDGPTDLWADDEDEHSEPELDLRSLDPRAPVTRTQIRRVRQLVSA